MKIRQWLWRFMGWIIRKKKYLRQEIERLEREEWT
jgi:hypothetical protein